MLFTGIRNTCIRTLVSLRPDLLAKGKVPLSCNFNFVTTGADEVARAEGKPTGAGGEPWTPVLGSPQTGS